MSSWYFCFGLIYLDDLWCYSQAIDVFLHHARSGFLDRCRRFPYIWREKIQKKNV